MQLVIDCITDYSLYDKLPIGIENNNYKDRIMIKNGYLSI